MDPRSRPARRTQGAGQLESIIDDRNQDNAWMSQVHRDPLTLFGKRKAWSLRIVAATWECSRPTLLGQAWFTASAQAVNEFVRHLLQERGSHLAFSACGCSSDAIAHSRPNRTYDVCFSR